MKNLKCLVCQATLEMSGRYLVDPEKSGYLNLPLTNCSSFVKLQNRKNAGMKDHQLYGTVDDLSRTVVRTPSSCYSLR